ncbi:hypothetical protein [Blastococcus xanthinilyticus]|uniref:Uncharacterized protein n=1 Tax=Blastococcus xanthinilyticus TaxID=1564164 RepID=A0A5S5CXC4_9ACTN|nr:hypothetical protein [Blastococcus xanthinilyticus]TYP88363.1 hypothetical protein BD833_10466 [Blastococcus xanthinilyticus]
MIRMLRAPVVLLWVAAGVTAGCGSAGEPAIATTPSTTSAGTADCDTTPRLADDPPAELVEQLGGAGDPQVVGTGRLFVLVPVEGTWGDAAERRRDEFYVKLGVWVGADAQPEIEVRSTDGDARGRAEPAPTAAGLPGFLPTGVHLPTAGCWRVTARLADDVAVIHIRVG